MTPLIPARQGIGIGDWRDQIHRAATARPLMVAFLTPAPAGEDEERRDMTSLQAVAVMRLNSAGLLVRWIQRRPTSHVLLPVGGGFWGMWTTGSRA